VAIRYRTAQLRSCTPLSSRNNIQNNEWRLYPRSPRECSEVTVPSTKAPNCSEFEEEGGHYLLIEADRNSEMTALLRVLLEKMMVA
jgi:hypothetical protein